LGESERKAAKEYGRKELAEICGPGKGIKISVADDRWAEDSSVGGWTVLHKPVIFVESDDPNTMGNVTAHLIGHSLGIEDHNPDSNNIMYESIPRGSNWDPNDVNEILSRVKMFADLTFHVGDIGNAYLLPAFPVADVRVLRAGLYYYRVINPFAAKLIRKK